MQQHQGLLTAGYGPQPTWDFMVQHDLGGVNPAETNFTDHQGYPGVSDNFSQQFQSTNERTSDMEVPKAPPGVDIDANIIASKSMMPWTYIDNFRKRRVWDYKKIPSEVEHEFEDFGNFHYGAVMAANGFPDSIIHRGAGAYHRISGELPEGTGNWWGEYPYGDQWEDQEQIARGIQYAKDKFPRVAADPINDQWLPDVD